MKLLLQLEASDASELAQLAEFFAPFTTNPTRTQIMATLQDIQQEVAETKAAVDSLVAVIASQASALTALQVQLDAAIAANDPAAFDAVKASLDELQAQAAAVVAANAPATPAP